MAGPLIALLLSPESSDLAKIAWGAFALASMLSLILNRNLRRQFALAADREQLAHERAVSLVEAERLANGIPVAEGNWEALCKAAARVKVAAPELMGR